MKVVVCGSRDWANPWPILCELRKLPLEATVIHGAARGADRLAGELAVGLGFREVLAVPADWRGKGKAAGAMCNRAMLGMKPDLVLAFPLRDSVGTRHMIDIARRAGVEVRVFEGGPEQCSG